MVSDANIVLTFLTICCITLALELTPLVDFRLHNIINSCEMMVASKIQVVGSASFSRGSLAMVLDEGHHLVTYELKS